MAQKKSIKSLNLIEPISKIIDNYEQIINNGNEYNYTKHDITTFKNLMSFASEQEFINSIENFRSYGRFSKWDEKCWDYIQNFQHYPENKFINFHLNECFQQLSNSLENLKQLIYKICIPNRTDLWEYEEPNIQYTKEQIKHILTTQEYIKRNIPYPDVDNEENVREYYNTIENDESDIYKYSCNVINAYTIFRTAIKREVVI